MSGKEISTNVNYIYYRISPSGNEEVLSLRCTQEEADGRLMLHAFHAAKEGYDAEVICSEDADVFVLC